VGVGLPQISFERDLIRKFYDEKEISGFEYSYVNPGMNRVMQAVGRLIRSENDRGIALLLDERYLQDRYRHLFKTEWDDYEVVTSPEDVKNICADFWKIN
jgi:DNA excision repair protein ERCC-2